MKDISESSWRDIRENQLLQVLAILGLALIGSRLILASDRNTLILLWGPLIFLYFLIRNTRAIVVFFILVCYVNYFIFYYQMPVFLTWYEELFSGAMLMASLGYVVFNKEKIARLRFFWQPFALILLLHAASFILNKQNMLQFFMASRKYYIYPVIFFGMIVIQAEQVVWEKLIKVMIFTMFFQVPVSIVQFFLFERADFMGGLFGKNSSAAISTLGIGFGFFGYYLYNYYERRRLYLFAGLAMIIPLVLAESKFGMILIPFAYIFNMFIERRQYFKKFLLILGMVPLYFSLLLAFDLINSHNPSYYPYMQRTLEDPLYMIKGAARMPEGISGARFDEAQGIFLPTYDRLSSLPFAMNYIRENTTKLLFGYGPGEASKDSYSQGQLVVLGVFPTFLVIALLEWGLLGTGAWLLLFAVLLRVNLKCLKHFQGDPTPSLWKAFIYFSNMQMFIFIFDFLYSRSFLLDYQAVFFWLTNGVVFWYYQNQVVQRNA
jgi:hypothetical protein